MDDANALLELALGSLGRLTGEGLRDADRSLAGALAADPFFPAARLLRAVTRVLVVANDRADQGPGLQSVGEAATRAGLDLRLKSLLRRIVDRDWPQKATPVNDPPAPADVLEMLQQQLRPALAAGLADLAFVPAHSRFTLALPKGIPALGGDREVDGADAYFVRALFSLSLDTLDALEDLDLEFDVGYLLATPTATAEDLLARFKSFGRRLAAPAPRAIDELTEGWFSLVQAYVLLNGETDPQDDDLIVFSSAFDVAARDRWQGDFRGAFESLMVSGSRPLVVDGHGVVDLDLRALTTPMDPRALSPKLAGFDPLAGTLPDPTFGGLLPHLDQVAATRLFHSAGEFELPNVDVTIDGDVRDWPAASEALLPVDVAGDAGNLPDLDLSRVFLGIDGDDLVARLSLVGGSFQYRTTQTTTFHGMVQFSTPRGRSSAIDPVFSTAELLARLR